MAELGKNAATESLQYYFSRLIIAIQDPVLAASELYSVKLVPLPVFEKMLTLGVSRCEKNGQLLSAIHSHLATNPSEIEKLIQILNVELNLQEIAKGMENKFEELQQKYMQERSNTSCSTVQSNASDNSSATNVAPPSKRICIDPGTNLLDLNDTSSAMLVPSNSQPPLTTLHKGSPIEILAGYLRSLYRSRKLPVYGKWPPTPSKQFINLAVILKEKVSRASADNFTKATLRGNSDDILHTKKRIHFSDLAKTKDGEAAQLILVEGAPGIGKSTFAWEACRKWGIGKILQQYKLMVLLRLREKGVQQAKTIADLFLCICNTDIKQKMVDLFQCNCNTDIKQKMVDLLQCNCKQKMVEEIVKNYGTGVLLVFEGFDELPAWLRTGDSLFMNIIKGERLSAATILITSRHWASRPLLLNDELHRPLSQHIEILGFTKKDIEDYLECMTFDDPTLLPGLQKYLSCYPNIASMMYVPLNCAIVLEIYRESRSDGNQLIPKTMTELYTSLVRTLLIRYLYDHPQYGDKYTRLLSIHDLPEPVYEQFCELARIAYEGICNDEQIIFSDLPDGFDTLGLMHCVPELYVDQGAVVSYHFLHLTLQEYLAAYHVSLMTSDMQIGHLKEGDSMIMDFIAGLTKLDFEEVQLAHFSRFVGNKDGGNWDASLFHWLFEAQNANLLQKLAKTNDKIFFFSNVGLYFGDRGPFDYYVLGYCVSRSNCKWSIILTEMSNEEAEMFVKGTVNCNALTCGKIVSLHVSLNDYKSVPLITLPACLLSDLIKYTTAADDGWNDLAKFVLYTPQLCDLTLEYSQFPQGSTIQLFESLSSLHFLSTLNIGKDDKYLTLHREDVQALGSLLSTSKSLTKLISGCLFADLGIEYIGNGLKQSTLVDLDISDCHIDFNGARHIAEGLCCNDTLRELQMGYNPIRDDGAKAIAEMLIKNKSLNVLNLNFCFITEVGAIKLADALCINSTLTEINLDGNTIKDQGAVALAQMLARNQSIMTLVMQRCDITELGAIKLAKALCINSTLTEINLYENAIKDEGAVALAQMLTTNRSLHILDVEYCSITEVGASHLARALLTNPSITCVSLHDKNISTSHNITSTDPRLRF